MRISEYLPTNWNQFVNLKPQNKIVAICLLVLGVSIAAVMANWGAKKIKRHAAQDFIEIFKKLGELPKIEQKHIGDNMYTLFPSVEFENMSAPIMQATDIKGRKLYAVKIHVSLDKKNNPTKLFEANEVLIVFQNPNANVWEVTGFNRNKQLLTGFPLKSTMEGKVDDTNKYNPLKQLIEKDRLEWGGYVYEVVKGK